MTKLATTQSLETAISAIQTVYREEISEMEDLLSAEQDKVFALEEENRNLKESLEENISKLRNLKSSLIWKRLG